MRVASVDRCPSAAGREDIRKTVQRSRSHRCHAEVRGNKGAQIVAVLILPLRWPTTLSLSETFEPKYNFISKISVKSADDVLGCPQQIEVWRRAHQPSSRIRLEHGFDKPKKIREAERAVRHARSMQKCWRLCNVTPSSSSQRRHEQRDWRATRQPEADLLQDLPLSVQTAH